MKNSAVTVFIIVFLIAGSLHADERLSSIELPPGFGIEIYAEGVENARQMVRGDLGTIFVGSRQVGKVWAVTDTDGDQRADQVRLIDENLNQPSGIEFLNGSLYVGAVSRILRYDDRDCKDYVPPAVKLQAHGAGLGLAFYTGEMFPNEYVNRLFIAQHGSWDRTEKVGYRVLSVQVEPGGRVIDKQVFASGWLQEEEVSGRPNDVLVMPDGALLVSDDFANVIYRISYTR